MATYSGQSSQHQTLTANTVDTVTLDADYNSVEVLNRGTAEIYFTVDGSTTPTVGGAGTKVVTGGSALRVDVVGVAGNTVVKLISTGATAYSVTGI